MILGMGGWGMMKTNFRWFDAVLIICMITGASAFYPNKAEATDLTVGANCTYTTISAALTAANPGDRLLIKAAIIRPKALPGVMLLLLDEK